MPPVLGTGFTGGSNPLTPTKNVGIDRSQVQVYYRLMSHPLREQVRALRRQGKSYGEITKQLGLGRSSIAYMVRDIVLLPEQLQHLQDNQRDNRERFALRSQELASAEDFRERQREFARSWWRGLSPVQRERIRQEDYKRKLLRHKTTPPTQPPRTLDVATYRLCLRVAPMLDYTPNWNYVDSHGRRGYVTVQCPDHPHRTPRGSVLVHRVVMECKLGRRLTRSDVVHHEDKNPHNNSAVNLTCTTLSAHGKLHVRPRATIPLVCDCCGRNFEREKRRHKPTHTGFCFCTRLCSSKFRRAKSAKFHLSDKATAGT